MKIRYSLTKKPQGTMRYRYQVAKHATGAISYFNHDKIHISENLTIQPFLNGQFDVQYIHIAVQPSLGIFFFSAS